MSMIIGRPGYETTDLRGDHAMLWASLLADLIVVFHATYVSFVVFGLVAILIGVAFRWSWVRNIWFRSLHLTAIGIVVARGSSSGSPAR